LLERLFGLSFLEEFLQKFHLFPSNFFHLQAPNICPFRPQFSSGATSGTPLGQKEAGNLHIHLFALVGGRALGRQCSFIVEKSCTNKQEKSTSFQLGKVASLEEAQKSGGISPFFDSLALREENFLKILNKFHKISQNFNFAQSASIWSRETGAHLGPLGPLDPCRAKLWKLEESQREGRQKIDELDKTIIKEIIIKAR